MNRELVVFPWLVQRDLSTSSAHSCGPWEFYDTRGLPREVRDEVQRVLSLHGYTGDRGVNVGTVVKHSEREWLSEIREEYVETGLQEVVTLAGLAKRQFYSGIGYLSAEVFQGYCWSLPEDRSPWSVDVQRRKDGQLIGLIEVDRPVVIAPSITRLLSHPVDLDWSLADAAYRAINSGNPWSGDAREALRQFQLASWDSQPMTPAIELVILNGAFQRLLRMRRGQRGDDFVDRMMGLARWSWDKVFDLDQGGDQQSELKEVEEWVQEFWRARGVLAHGRSALEQGDFKWTLQGHVVLASFLFPLLFSCFLMREKFLRVDAFRNWGHLRVFPRLVLLRPQNRSRDGEEEGSEWAKLVADEAYWPSIPIMLKRLGVADPYEEEAEA